MVETVEAAVVAAGKADGFLARVPDAVRELIRDLKDELGGAGFRRVTPMLEAVTNLVGGARQELVAILGRAEPPPPPVPPPLPRFPSLVPLKFHRRRVVVDEPGAVLNDVHAPEGLEIRAPNVRVRRFLVDECDLSRAVEVSPEGRGAVLEWGTVARYPGAAFYIAAPGATVYRCHMTDQRGDGKREGDGEVLGCSILVGVGKGTSGRDFNASILENLLERLHWHQGIELKSGGNVVEGNTAIGGRAPADLFTRHGPGNTYRHNFVRDGRIWLADERGLAVGNVTVGERACLGIAAGTLAGDELRQGRKGHPFSDGGRVEGHVGPVVVGFDPNAGGGGAGDWRRKPVGTVLLGVDARQVRGPKGSYTVEKGQAPASEARELGRREVGHDARG
jgi:hypothetical protein